MTWDSVSAIAKTAWHAVLIVGLLFALVLLSRACDGENRAKAELERARESALAEKAGLGMVQEAKAASLRLELDSARKDSADFAEALQKAEAALRARPVIVVRAGTGPVPVETPEEPNPPTKPDGMPAERPCMLKPGDQGEILVTEAILETEAGNRVLVGAAEAFRVDPPPRARLFHGTFKAEVTEAKGEPVPLPNPPGWGVGLFAGASSDGVAVGPAIAFPPVRLLGIQLEGVLAGGANPSTGKVQASGTGIARW